MLNNISINAKHRVVKCIRCHHNCEIIEKKQRNLITESQIFDFISNDMLHVKLT